MCMAHNFMMYFFGYFPHESHRQGLKFALFRYSILKFSIIAAVGSTLFLTTDFDVMTRASFLDRVITMQLDSKYRRNLVFC